MTIHTTYFAALDHDLVEPDDDHLVAGVVRRPADWTRDLVDRNIQSVAPPEDLLDAVKTVEEAADSDDDIDDPRRVAWSSTDFAVRYQSHLLSARLDRVLGQLRTDEREQGAVWLVCYEKDPAFCHRRLLADELARGRTDDPVHHPEPDSSIETETTAHASLSDFDGGQA